MKRIKIIFSLALAFILLFILLAGRLGPSTPTPRFVPGNTLPAGSAKGIYASYWLVPYDGQKIYPHDPAAPFDGGKAWGLVWSKGKGGTDWRYFLYDLDNR